MILRCCCCCRHSVGFFFFWGGFQGLQFMAVRGSPISVDGNSHSLLLLNHNLEFFSLFF